MTNDIDITNDTTTSADSYESKEQMLEVRDSKKLETTPTVKGDEHKMLGDLTNLFDKKPTYEETNDASLGVSDSEEKLKKRKIIFHKFQKRFRTVLKKGIIFFKKENKKRIESEKSEEKQKDVGSETKAISNEPLLKTTLTEKGAEYKILVDLSNLIDTKSVHEETNNRVSGSEGKLMKRKRSENENCYDVVVELDVNVQKKRFKDLTRIESKVSEQKQKVAEENEKFSRRLSAVLYDEEDSIEEKSDVEFTVDPTTKVLEVLTKDIPERMQLRTIPITPAVEKELVKEAQWIYKQAFECKTISIQDSHLSEEAKMRVRKDPQVVAKIQKVLDFMRNQHFEVPFIYSYRKEYVLPELDIDDMWKIYKFDAKWCQFQRRKKALLKYFQKIQRNQDNHVIQDPDKPLPSNMRLIEEEDLKHLHNVQTMDELIDHLKQGVRTGPYFIYRKAGLDNLTKKFGLTPQQFTKNLSKGLQIYEIKQEPIEPSVLAAEYVGLLFQTVDQVLKAAQSMVAIQLAREPLLRQSVRKMYRKNAKISIRPTQKGITVIDENHPIYTMKYLKDKPVGDLVDDQYLKLVMAEKEELITISFSDEIDYVTEMKKLYYRYDLSETVENWNILRVGSVAMALNDIVIPDLKKELHFILLNEAKDCVMRACIRKFRNSIKIAPYKRTYEKKFDKTDKQGVSEGLRVMGLTLSSDSSEEDGYVCMVTPNGECEEYLKLPNLLKDKNSDNKSNRDMKLADVFALKCFIISTKPDVIAIGGESPEALTIAKEIEEIVKDLIGDDNAVDVVIVENDLAKVYAGSHRGTSEFPSHSKLQREAISVARRLQNPLLEFSQLSNDEIVDVKFHCLQDQLSKEELRENFYQEFVNCVNEVGVDLNKAVAEPNYSNLVQFVCGLGSLKAQLLIKNLKQTDLQRLENRSQLITSCNVGPKVFVNCAGFIKIDKTNLEDSEKADVNVLDSSRIHPESYGCAEKMAENALDLADEDPAEALKQILESPKSLKILDLDTFAPLSKIIT